MNSLRALSSRASRRCISLKVAGELADLVAALDRDRRREVALGDLLRRRLEPAQALRVRPGREPARRQRGEQRDHAGDQDLAPDQRDVVVDVGERRSRARRPSAAASAGDSGTAASPMPLRRRPARRAGLGAGRSPPRLAAAG